MSQINVNRIKDSNEGAPDFPSGVNVSGITSTVTLGVTNLNPTNVNVSGVVTATTLDGNLLATGTPTLGLGVTINTSGVNISGVATAGIVSATTLYGNGANITGVALTIAPLNYNPALNGVDVSKSPGIGFTFNQGVKAGSGEVTLRLVGAAGTVVQTWGVGSSITYSNGDEISMSLVSELDMDTVYHLSYPSGAFTNIGGDVSYVGTAYTFDTKPATNQLWGFGRGDFGMLGQNNTVSYSSPVQLPGNPVWEKVYWGNNQNEYVLAVKSDNTLWSWGNNEEGVIGDNSNAHRSSPTQIPGTTWSKSFTGSQRSALAVKTDGTMWTWGSNSHGQLGLNQATSLDVSSPVQIPGTTWTTTEDKVKRMGNYHVAFIKTDGTLWAWGSNYYGNLGQNQGPSQLGNASSPIQIPGTTWSVVSCMRSGMAATKTDGTLWTWGRAAYGFLGQNSSTVDRSSPTQVPGTNWRTISAAYGACATKTDGTLWMWGRNSYRGILGQNDTVDYSSPVQVPGTTWDKAEFRFTAIATKTDGTMWGWGDNSYGRLGLNDEVQRSSPVQLPGFTNPVNFSTGRRNWVIKLG